MYTGRVGEITKANEKEFIRICGLPGLGGGLHGIADELKRRNYAWITGGSPRTASIYDPLYQPPIKNTPSAPQAPNQPPVIQSTYPTAQAHYKAPTQDFGFAQYDCDSALEELEQVVKRVSMINTSISANMTLRCWFIHSSRR